jgi:hypothetical protein
MAQGERLCLPIPLARVVYADASGSWHPDLASCWPSRIALLDHLVIRGEQGLRDGEARVSLAFFRLMTNSTFVNCCGEVGGLFAFGAGAKEKAPV